MAKFELKTWMTENREIIISNYSELTKERFFNGISLKEFMTTTFTSMVNNNIKSAKRAAKMLPFLMGNVYFNNSIVGGCDEMTDKLRAKYTNTAYMALV